jgi:hypothetical protein
VPVEFSHLMIFSVGCVEKDEAKHKKNAEVKQEKTDQIEKYGDNEFVPSVQLNQLGNQ